VGDLAALVAFDVEVGAGVVVRERKSKCPLSEAKTAMQGLGR
jgi:hypothetical protein